MVYREGKEQVFVEKEKIRLVDQIVLIPRWGIRVPFLVNSLLGRDARASGQPHEAAGDEFASNVTPLKKAH